MRAEIAASLLHDPEVLFLDEPTLGLDAVAKEGIRLLLTETNREGGTTIFLTTHDMGDIEALCDRVVIIDEGTIICDGTTEDLRNLEHENHVDVEFLPVPESSPLATGEAVAKSLALIQRYAVDSTRANWPPAAVPKREGTRCSSSLGRSTSGLRRCSSFPGFYGFGERGASKRRGDR